MQALLGHAVSYRASWAPEDAVVYAAAVGADPRADLDYLDLLRGPKVVPSFLGARASRSGQATQENFAAWEFEPQGIFTLSCDMSFVAELPAGADAECDLEYVELWDKGSSAIAVGQSSIGVHGHAVGRVRTTVMFRGRGGFGGERGPARTPSPELEGALELPVRLPGHSAVLFQLVGDHNPHSLDAAFAKAMGLPGPISAGQLLIGAAGRAITQTFADGNHTALRRIAVDFVGTHLVGEPLTLKVQPNGSNTFDFALFASDLPVLHGGRAELG
jgi:acyl dehydratase